MTWLEYAKGKLAYDLACMGIGLALAAVGLVFLLAVEASDRRRRRRGAK